MTSPDEHAALLDAALAAEREAHAALVAGDAVTARDAFREASDHYRASWEAAPPTAFGRLVGMLKAAVLAGEGETAARYVHAAVGEQPASPTSAYAVALAALVHGDDALAVQAADVMRGGSDAFDRTADAIAALAAQDGAAYTAALAAIVADFAARDAHLTGVAIADTAIMLERLAAFRGMRSDVRSPLLPGS